MLGKQGGVMAAQHPTDAAVPFSSYLGPIQTMDAQCQVSDQDLMVNQLKDSKMCPITGRDQTLDAWHTMMIYMKLTDQ